MIADCLQAGTATVDFLCIVFLVVSCSLVTLIATLWGGR